MSFCFLRAATKSFTRRSVCYSASTRYFLRHEKRVVNVLSRSRYTTRDYSTGTPSNATTEAISFGSEELSKALELMVESSQSLPPIPPDQDQEMFWRAYLLANQIIVYLAARPPMEVEAFATLFQSASVPANSPIARGRIGVLKLTTEIVRVMDGIPPTSTLNSSHPEVFQAFKALKNDHDAYVGEGSVDDLERWSKFFVGLRTDLIEFTTRIGTVVEGWESVERQSKK
ncbi:hypothetical protein FB446DRAFT_737821 [Lentinula raphanica]|nr:hypothetical protein FB446DRAFT_737821 [Lentinula raphanica]